MEREERRLTVTHHFWNLVRNEDNSRTLYLNGPIAHETWWGDEVTPKVFKDELFDGEGDVTVWINSPGGDVFCAAEIYTALKEYPGKVTVKIDSLAASAASVIAMAGDEVCMSPLAHMIIHDPETIAIGPAAEMDKAKAQLLAVKENIVNAYQLKTGLPRAKLSDLMTAETTMTAKQAVDLGFADKILYAEGMAFEDAVDPVIFSRAAVTNSFVNKFRAAQQRMEPAPGREAQIKEGTQANAVPPTANNTGIPIESLYKRLDLLSRP